MRITSAYGERLPRRLPRDAGGPADWLCLAAAPVFAGMALLTAVSTDPDLSCLSGPSAAPLGGMTLMYLLMSAFHVAPWLRMMSRRDLKES